MTPDLINGVFETVGGLLLFLHSRRVVKDKEVKGVSVPPMLFFLGWGFWNLFYYPHLDQWFSFLGGCVILAGNILWVALVIHYKGGFRWLARPWKRLVWTVHFMTCCAFNESEYLGPHGRSYGPVLRQCTRCGRRWLDDR